MPSVAIKAKEWPDMMDVQTAIAFAASYGVQVGEWQLRNGDRSWPRGHKVANGISVRWRRDELLAAIARRKSA
jgi:hypothetical protein